jgi:glycosyltransferase involved in cell wall biosynthesis
MGLKSYPKRIAVVGNYLPRICGIATFTSDLCEALANKLPNPENVIAIAMDDIENGYDYPERVKFEIRENVLRDYISATDFLNLNQIDTVILQHEYGIFGGKDGVQIIHMLKNLRIPIITTLHTVLSKPSCGQRAIIQELAKYSQKFVVMAHKAKEILHDIYKIPDSMISIISHGIPDIPFVDPYFYKDKFGLEDKRVILTFGLIGPSKGIEFMIEALPKIIEKHDNTIYIILGVTHPSLLKTHGEEYRHFLQLKVKNLSLEDHVQFHNKFVDLETLTEYLIATDIYMTPYLSKEQITSGTLAYAIGAGNAVVSTPYLYAEELLANGRGRLVPFRDSESISKEINELLSNEHKRNTIRKKAYLYGRSMVWKEVAERYLRLVGEVFEQRPAYPAPLKVSDPIANIIDELPRINLHHFQILTDDTGILQHSFFTIPNREHGYCIDDNARALVVSCMYHNLRKDDQIIKSIKIYLAFIYHAFNYENNRFRNFMLYGRTWSEEMGSEDSHGRALWGLGVAVNNAPNGSIRDMATRLFCDAVTVVESFTSPRAWSFAILGMYQYLKIFSGDARVRKSQEILAEKLYTLYIGNFKPDWPWFEDKLTYANANLSHGLIIAGHRLSRLDIFEAGIFSLEWIIEKQMSSEGHISVIGNQDWHKKNGKRSKFDQQPIEIMNLVQTCATAFRFTGDKKWIKMARKCFSWFLGQNDLGIQLYNYQTGGCKDGLQSQGVNANEGAESTLSWMISLLTMYKLFEERVLAKEPSKKAEHKTSIKEQIK